MTTTTSPRPDVAPPPGAPIRVRPVPWCTPRVAVVLLTVAGAGIRLMITRGFWLDEATSGADARLSYGAMLRALTHDNHPPLDYTVLWAVAHTLGSTETDLRLPSILFGTLTIPVLYLAGRALYAEWVGVGAAALGSVGALAVWYSQEARMYSLFMLAATVTIWALARALATDRRRYWWAWGAASVVMVWTQWFAALAVGAELVVVASALIGLRRDRRARRPFRHALVATAGVAVACAPGVPLLLTQFHNNQANGLGFGGHAAAGAAGGLSPYGIFNNVVWALWGYHSNGVIAGAVAVWPLGILGVLLLLGRGRHPAHTLLATVAFLPLLAVFVASAEAAPNRSLFEVRYFIEAVPALYLLVAGMVWTMAPTVRIRRVVGAVVAVSFVVGLVTQQTDGDNPRLYGYDAAFAALSARARPGDEILYAPAYVNVDVGYFEPGMRAAPVGTTPPSLPGSARIFVVAMTNFAGADVAAETGSLLSRLERTRRLELVLRAPNVELWELS